MRSAIFWDITQRRVGIPYRSSETTWTSGPLNIGPICHPETSVRNYQHSFLNNPEERRAHLHRVGRLKSRNCNIYLRESFLGALQPKLEADHSASFTEEGEECTNMQLFLYTAKDIYDIVLE
jgi:hypothetical protein